MKYIQFSWSAFDLSQYQRMVKFLALVITSSTILLTCNVLEPGLPSDEEVLDGPVIGLTQAESIQFLAGDAAFNNEVFISSTGLGPLFVASSCGACHTGDGKGHPFTSLTRFGQSDTSGNKYLNLGGPQLQHRAIPGYLPEALPVGATYSKLVPPANTGLGFIELVSDQEILSMADPEDKDGDGISGIPNWTKVPAYVNIPPTAVIKDGKNISRFGKKGAAFDLLHQTVNAYNQDMGINTSFEPYDTYSGRSISPEIPDQTVRNVVFYLQTLKAPIPRNNQEPSVVQGKKLFIDIGCESCHRQSLHTRTSTIKALSNKTFYPYTDLLLHDMGPGLDDGYTEGSATTAEWRTPPLWGLGLAPASQGGHYYLLHDGRAQSIDQAIEMHGGEADRVVKTYSALSPIEKSSLLRFLKSL